MYWADPVTLAAFVVYASTSGLVVLSHILT
jgi:hypothetical protein